MLGRLLVAALHLLLNWVSNFPRLFLKGRKCSFGLAGVAVVLYARQFAELHHGQLPDFGVVEDQLGELWQVRVTQI